MSATNVDEQYEAHQRLERMIKALEERVRVLEAEREVPHYANGLPVDMRCSIEHWHPLERKP